MKPTRAGLLIGAAFAILGSAVSAAPGNAKAKPPKVEPVELVPNRPLKRFHPRLLIHERPGRYATSMAELRKLASAKANRELLDVVRQHGGMAGNALLYLATKEKAAGEAALGQLRQWTAPEARGSSDRLEAVRHVCLAYDWLYNHPDFTEAEKKAVRDAMLPVAEAASSSLFGAGAHVFHLGYYCDAGIITYAACAFGVEDERFAPFVGKTREAWNEVLLPALKYAGGVPGEPLGSWTIYALRAVGESMRLINSAFGTDVFLLARRRHKGFLAEQVSHLVHGTLPDLRFVEWGYLAEGPNGGATLEAAVTVDALAGACGSADGVWFSRRLEKLRGHARYYPPTALFFFAYGGRPTVTRGEGPPKETSRVFQTADGGGHAFFRTGWKDEDMIIAFRCTDHFGSRNHWDQGGVLIYKKGPLVIDPAANVAGEGEPQSTAMHNTLLIGGAGQRPVQGMTSTRLDHFLANRTEGRRLGTGSIEAFRAFGKTNYVIGDFTAAYEPTVAKKVRRALFLLQPDTVVIVDLVETDEVVTFLLHLPRPPAVDAEANTVTGGNGSAGLICQTVWPQAVSITSAETLAAYGVSVTPGVAEGAKRADPVVLAHVIKVSDTADPPKLPECSARLMGGRLRIRIGRRTVTIPTKGKLVPTVF